MKNKFIVGVFAFVFALGLSSETQAQYGGYWGGGYWGGGCYPRPVYVTPPMYCGPSLPYYTPYTPYVPVPRIRCYIPRLYW